MIRNYKKRFVEPLLYAVAVFVLVLALVQYLVYEEYLIAQENEREKLQQELSRVKDEFRGILNSNITVANALAVIHKNYGSTYNFDSTARQLMANNKFVDALQITEGGVIAHVYPHDEYDKTLGLNTLADSMRKKEAERAIKRSDIYFAGPRKLREGGIGILGKVPILSDGKVIGLSVVLTRLPTIVGALGLNDSTRHIYSYKLVKNNSADSAAYYFTDMRPGGMLLSTRVPEGDWTLTVAFSTAANKSNFPIVQSVISFLLALFAGIFTYRRIRQPYFLNDIIDAKTKELSAREKYYRTITEANFDATVLLDGNGKVLYQTPSVEKILGYSLAEMQQTDGIELMHPSERDSDNVAFAALIQERGKITHMTHRIKSKKGNYLWIECTYRNLLHDENVRAIVLNYHDITDKVNAQHQLGERVKELTTIYYTNEILKDDQQSMEEVFRKIAEILPPGWQYPDICAARIIFEGQEFRTANYRPSDFVQSEHFTLEDGRQGALEVIYIAETPVEYEGPFLKEERDLIKALAETIKVHFNKTSKQRELVKSEANFRSSFEHAAIGMALVAPDGTFVKVNNALFSMLGYSEEELLSLTFAGITHPEHVDADLENVNQILSGSKDFYRTEKRYIHKNGSEIWVNLNSAVIRDSSSRPLYFVSQIENITERKESQQKFQNLVEGSLVGVYILQNGRFAYVNPRIVEESGYSEEELLSMPIDKFVYEEDMEQVRSNIQARLSGEQIEARYEVRASKKSGEVMWLEMFGSATLYGGTPAIIGTMVNITGKKAAFDELERSEANLRSIFENSEILYLLLDSDFRVIALNQRMQDIYTAVAGQLLAPGVSLPETLLPEKREPAMAVYVKVKNEKRPIIYETRYALSDRTLHFMAHVVPILVNGEVTGICISSVEITDLKRLELERKKIIGDLLNRNRDLQEFAEIVSHNLRGPLATLLGLTGMLANGVTESEKDFVLEGVETYARKLDSVVMDLNNILVVKNDGGETRVNIDLYELMTEVKQKFAELVEKTGAEINIDLTAVPELFSIRSYIYNMLYSLVSNSLVYRDRTRTPRIRVWTEQRPGAIFLAVADNGIGIDMNKYRDHLFQVNKRFHNTTEGKGLGLYTVKAQVDILNGTIEIESEPGVGTTVRITLPV